MFVDYILQWARNNGYKAVYGSPEQVNEMLTNVPFADSNDGTAVIMHLVADSETYNGHDRAILAVYFASLCHFDFNGESLLPEQERLKNIGKDLLNDIRTGNVLAYEYPRWQYGYDDYAENICWVCLRVTLTALAADCVPMPMPEPPTLEMTPLPDFSAEVLSFNGYSNPIERDGLIASAHELDRLCMVFVGVTPEYSGGGADTYVTINGNRDYYGLVIPDLITEEMVEDIQQLAPYIGQMVWFVGVFEGDHPETSFCVEIDIEGVWSSGEICWEE